MSGPEASFADGARTRLRATVATIEREISRLPGQAAGEDGKSPPSGLLASFTDLVEQLALGPEPEVRRCPVCQHLGMRMATLCGYCWTKLTPPTGHEGAAG
jgi:hypothetical protein